MKIVFSLLIVFLVCTHCLADSPITSTSFYTAYNEIPEIYNAEKDGLLNFESATFLSSSKISVDKKVALINALGWDINGKKNLALYLQFLQAKYKTNVLKYSILTADEHLCAGYLAVMDDYFHVRAPLMIIKSALARNPKSYTYNIIYGLVLGQMSQDAGLAGVDSTWGADLIDERFLDLGVKPWCNIYMTLAKIEADKSLIQDFRKSAKRNIFSYANLYKSFCSPSSLILIPSTSHLEELIETKISLTKKEGIYKVPVQINGYYAIDFILDSGASDILISSGVFSDLIRAGKIEKSDILGYSYYQIADGSTVKQMSVMLRKIQIGQIVVNNVKASVGTTATPLLLGQSFMQKFKQFTIDNENGFLIIDPKSVRL